MDDKGYSYRHDLVVGLETEIQNWQDEREQYWAGLLEEAPSALADVIYDQAERFATAVLTNTEQLLSTEQLDDDLRTLDGAASAMKEWEHMYNREAKEIMDSKESWDNKGKRLADLFRQRPPDAKDENSPLRLVWERLCIQMAESAVAKIETGADRIVQLYRLVLQSSPSVSTRAFLSRLSRCYIFGFDCECVILCRSVIDTAFRKKVSDQICERHLGKRRRCQFTLTDRIHAAWKEGILDNKMKDIVVAVKQRGDKAVHYQPDITKDVWQTIRDTVIVLEKLHQNRR
jgi:hypothetical protein